MLFRVFYFFGSSFLCLVLLVLQGCDDQYSTRFNKLESKVSTLQNDLKQETNYTKLLEAEIKRIGSKSTLDKNDNHEGSRLTLQIGLAMTRLVLGTTKTGEEILGDAVPVKNTKVYLLRKSCLKFFEGMEGNYISPNHKDSMQLAWIRSLTPNAYAGPRSLAQAAIKARTILEQNAVAVGFTDFSGKVEFTNLTPGAYVVCCATYLDAGAILEKNISQTTVDQYVNLSNDDVVLDSKERP
jgi:hypothetical protein